MRGRTRKVYLAGEEPILTTIKISKKTRSLIPDSLNLSQFVTQAIQARYADKDTAELEELEKKKENLERELSILTLRIQELKSALKEKTELAHLIEQNIKFSAYIIRYFIIEAKKQRSNLIPSTTLWGLGIDLNYSKLLSDFQSIKIKIEEMTDQEIIDRYNLQYDPSRKQFIELRNTIYEQFLKRQEMKK